MTDDTKDFSSHMALAAELGLRGARDAVDHILVEHDDQAVAFLAALCRLEYVKHTLVLGARGFGIDTATAVGLAGTAALTVALERMLNGKLTKDDALALLGGRWRAEITAAAANLPGSLTPEAVRQAMADVAKGAEAGKALTD